MCVWADICVMMLQLVSLDYIILVFSSLKGVLHWTDCSLLTFYTIKHRSGSFSPHTFVEITSTCFCFAPCFCRAVDRQTFLQTREVCNLFSRQNVASTGLCLLLLWTDQRHKKSFLLSRRILGNVVFLVYLCGLLTVGELEFGALSPPIGLECKASTDRHYLN